MMKMIKNIKEFCFQILCIAEINNSEFNAEQITWSYNNLQLKLEKLITCIILSHTVENDFLLLAVHVMCDE